jgi:hypothetical protein
MSQTIGRADGGATTPRYRHVGTSEVVPDGAASPEAARRWKRLTLIRRCLRAASARSELRITGRRPDSDEPLERLERDVGRDLVPSGELDVRHVVAVFP